MVDYQPTPEELEIQNRCLININAQDYLASTDWYITRFLETGVVIPTDVTTSREAARESIV